MGTITRTTANNLTTNQGEGVMVKLQTATISAGTSAVEFTSQIDSTYTHYCWKFISLHCDTNDKDLVFALSTDAGSSYNVAKTGSGHQQYMNEANGSDVALALSTIFNAVQVTGTIKIGHSLGTDNDQACSGEFWLFNPSSTTFVKNYRSDIQNYHQANFAQQYIVQGYANTSSAITGIKFAMDTGNLDAGTIVMYGVK
tara:strand:- start:347 stop:943 length:597 start_codon:yes stop_codon:yes gene_type:complete